MDVAEMKIIGKNNPSANVNMDQVKGSAVAAQCIKYATKRMEEEEKQHGKLKMIIRDIASLTHGAHVEFRAQLTAELTLAKELSKSVGVTRAQTAGYSLNSFIVLVSNWKTISTACELGYVPADKEWPLVVAESVQIRQAHASKGKVTKIGDNGEEVETELPIKRKVGRQATPLIDKAINAAKELLENNPEKFVEFAAWVAKNMPVAKKV